MTILIGSTLLSVLSAGLVLSWLAGDASTDPAGLLGGLLLVVALPCWSGSGYEPRFVTARARPS